MKYTGLLSLTLFSCIAHSASHITYLNVDNGFVHFSTQTSKAASAPSCAVSDTNEQYAVSLANENGRAVYSLLITAMSSSQAVDVISAGDCADVDGIERASGVSLIPTVVNESNSKELYLYQGDDETKIGRIVNYTDNLIYYLEGENNTEFKYYQPRQLSKQRVFFSEKNCTGNSYILRPSFQFQNEYFSNNNYFLSSSVAGNYVYWSQLNTNGSCSTRTSSASTELYPFSSISIGICGIGPCRIREE